MNEFKKGDRVRVVLEGEVVDINGDGFELEADPDIDTLYVGPRRRAAFVKSVEKIEPPVEVFKPGDRLKYKGGVSSEITVGENGYLQHYEDGQVIWYKSDQEFTSEDYERVYPGAGE